MATGNGGNFLPPPLQHFLCVSSQATYLSAGRALASGGSPYADGEGAGCHSDGDEGEGCAARLVRARSECIANQAASKRPVVPPPSDRVLLARSRLENLTLRKLVGRLRAETAALQRRIDDGAATPLRQVTSGEPEHASSIHRYALLCRMLRALNARLRARCAALEASARDLGVDADEPTPEEAAECAQEFERLYRELLTSHANGQPATGRLMPAMLSELVRMPDEGLRSVMFDQFALLARDESEEGEHSDPPYARDIANVLACGYCDEPRVPRATSHLTLHGGILTLLAC